MRLDADLAASAIGTAVLLAAVVLSFKYSPTARLVPLVIGIPTLVLMVIQLVFDSVPSVRRLRDLGKRDVFGAGRYLKEAKRRREAPAGEKTGEAAPVGGHPRLLWAGLFVLGIGVGAYLLGFFIAIPVALFAFLRWASRESWVSAAVTTLATSAALWVTFVVFLKVSFFQGVLFLIWR